MENMGLEMFKIWKSSWQSYVKTIQMMQEQGDKMVDHFLAQSDAVREETQKMLREGMINAQQAQKTYFKAVAENLKRFEELFEK